MGKQLAITENGVFTTGSKAFLTVDGVHRKVLKMFQTTDGVHRLCFSGGGDVATMGISYTGNMTDEIVTMSGVQYRLLTLTSSGTLTVDEKVNAEVWLCDGGNSASVGGNTGGGAGAYVASGTVVLSEASVAIIGSGGRAGNFGGETSFMDIKPKGEKKYIEQGGSAGGSNSGSGRGDGITKYPFGDSVYFAGKCHCAGGGAGAYACYFADVSSGEMQWNACGGSNGGGQTGGHMESLYSPECDIYGGSGGSFGGGDGGNLTIYDLYDASTEDGYNAFWYGSGGGGASCVDMFDENEDNVTYHYGSGGQGYQGVIYVRIPINQ